MNAYSTFGYTNQTTKFEKPQNNTCVIIWLSKPPPHPPPFDLQEIDYNLLGQI